MLISKALALKGVGILLCLSKPAYAPKKRTIVTLVLFSYIGIIYKLSSFNCSNYFVNSFRFGIFIAHFVLVVKTRFALFWCETGFNAGARLFYPLNNDFLINHNGASPFAYWANWDLCNMASVLGIGVLTDNTTMYEQAIWSLPYANTSHWPMGGSLAYGRSH